MRKFFILFIAFIIILSFTGCGVKNNTNISEPPLEENLKEPSPPLKNPEGSFSEEPPILKYENVEEIDTLPPKIIEVIDYIKKQRGFFFFDPDDYSTGEDAFVLISAGEKPTGGYLLTIKSLTFKNDSLEIIIEEKEPGVEEGVIQVITYPFAIIKLINFQEKPIFSIVNQKLQPFEEISPEAIPSINREKGTYIGQIDSNFIEIEVKGETKAFMLENQELIWQLKEGDKIIVEFFKDEYNRPVIKNIEKTN